MLAGAFVTSTGFRVTKLPQRVFRHSLTTRNFRVLNTMELATLRCWDWEDGLSWPHAPLVFGCQLDSAGEVRAFPGNIKAVAWAAAADPVSNPLRDSRCVSCPALAVMLPICACESSQLPCWQPLTHRLRSRCPGIHHLCTTDRLRGGISPARWGTRGRGGLQNAQLGWRGVLTPAPACAVRAFRKTPRAVPLALSDLRSGQRADKG